MNLLECLLKMLQDGKMKEIEDLKSLEKIYEVSRREGYEGTYEEFEKEYEELIMNASHEISEKSLEKVSGGKMSKNLSKSTAAILSALTLSSVVTPSSSAASKYSFQNIKKNNSVVNFVKNNPGKVLATTAATLASLGLGVVFIAGVAHFVKKGSGAFDSCKTTNEVLKKLSDPNSIGRDNAEFMINLNSLVNFISGYIDKCAKGEVKNTLNVTKVLAQYIFEAKEKLGDKFPSEETVNYLRDSIKNTNLRNVSGMDDNFMCGLNMFTKGENYIRNVADDGFAQLYIDKKLRWDKNINLDNSNSFRIEVENCRVIDEYINVIEVLKNSGIKFSVKGDKDKKERYFEKIYYRAESKEIIVIVEGDVKGVKSLELDKLNFDNTGWAIESQNDNKATYTKSGVDFSIVEEDGKYSISRDLEEIIPTNPSDESTEEADDVVINDSTGPNGETGTTSESSQQEENNSNPKEEKTEENKKQTGNNEEPVKNQGGPNQTSGNNQVNPEENIVVNQTSEENKQEDEQEDEQQVINENEQPLNGNKVENQEKKEEGKPEEASKEEGQSNELKKKSGDDVLDEGKGEKLVEHKEEGKGEVKEEAVQQNENQLPKTDDRVIELDFSGVPEDKKKKLNNEVFIKASVIDADGREISREEDEEFYNQLNEWFQQANAKAIEKNKNFKDAYKFLDGKFYFKEKLEGKVYNSDKEDNYFEILSGIGAIDKSLDYELIKNDATKTKYKVCYYYLRGDRTFVVVADKNMSSGKVSFEILSKKHVEKFINNTRSGLLENDDEEQMLRLANIFKEKPEYMEATVVDDSGREISREDGEAFYNQLNEWLENASEKYSLFRDHYKNDGGKLYFKEKEIANDFDLLCYKDGNISNGLRIGYTKYYTTQNLHAYYIQDDKVSFLVVVDESYRYDDIVLRIVPKEFAKKFMENNFKTDVEKTSIDENRKKFDEFINLLEEQPNNQA